MSEGVEQRLESVGTRWVLPCGHRLTLPWNLSPEVAASEMLRHRSACELGADVSLHGSVGISPGTWLGSGEVGR